MRMPNWEIYFYESSGVIGISPCHADRLKMFMARVMPVDEDWKAPIGLAAISSTLVSKKSAGIETVELRYHPELRAFGLFVGAFTSEPVEMGDWKDSYVIWRLDWDDPDHKDMFCEISS